MAEFERIEKVSYLRIFTHNINKRKFMISCCDHITNITSYTVVSYGVSGIAKWERNCAILDISAEILYHLLWSVSTEAHLEITT